MNIIYYRNAYKAYVGVGKTNHSEIRSQDYYRVDHWKIYDGFSLNMINDIALIHTSEPIEFNDKVQPIPLNNEDLEDGAEGVVTGWGDTEVNY